MKTNRPFQLFFLFLCLSILKVTIASQTPSIDDPSELKPDDTITREMTGKVAHRYKFDLKKNEFFQGKAEQKGIDITLKLFDANGKTLAEMDSPNGKTGFETLSFIASNNGNFILEIISPDEKAEKGSYTLNREFSRTATAEDKRRVEVEKIFAEGVKLRNIEGQAEIAIAKLEESLSGWQEFGDEYLVNLTIQILKEFKENRHHAIFLRLFNDLQKANNISIEGSKLSFTSKSDALAGRKKLNEALVLYRSLLDEVNSKELLEKIQRPSMSQQSLYWLRSLQYYAKGGETSCLDRIAQTYYFFGEWQDYITYKKLALAGYQEILSNKEWQTVIAPNVIPSFKILEIQKFKEIGESLADYLGKNEEGLIYLNKGIERARALYEETQNPISKRLEAQILTTSAFIYGRQSKTNSKSIELTIKALDIYRTLPNEKHMEAEMLSLIALRYMTNLQYAEARKNFEEALQIFKDRNDKFGQSTIVQALAVMFSALNNKTETIKYANQNLLILQSPDYAENYLNNFEKNTHNLKDFEIFRENQTFFIEYVRLGAMGLTYRLMEDYPKALEFYKKTLDAARHTKDLNKIRGSLFDVGFTLEKLGRWNEAVIYFSEQVEISRQLGNKEFVAESLHEVGEALFEAGKSQEALKYQNEALLLFQEVEIEENKAFSLTYSSFLNQISRTHYSLGNKNSAIFYGKRAVNAMQSERNRLQNLDLISQKGFLEKKEKHYRRLTEWLIESGRLVEAERVLEMLKDEEIGDYLRRDTAFVQKTALQIEYNSAEKKAIEDYRNKSETLSSIGAEFAKLEHLKRKNVKLTAEQDKQFTELNAKLTKANRDFQDFLTQLSAEFEKVEDPVGDSREEYNLQTNLEEWGGNIVFIYTLIGNKHIRAILTTQKIKIKKDKEITPAELNKKIYAFREAVKNPNIDPRPLGKELYDILILPIEEELKGAKAKMILWRLDGNLRLLPLAALWDGKQYFGQKYQNVVITGKSLSNIGREISPNLNVLGLGVSESKTIAETLTDRKFTFSALPAVPSELSSIVKTRKSPKGVLPGESLLDVQFTRKNFEERLGKRYKIVHIASHFSVNAGDASRSFLLLGDGSILSVNELNENPLLKFTGVELLTLSACDTAVGETDSNAREVEGFAYVAQQNGAKAILATLWSVADNSTQLLMTEFYRLRKANPNLTKAEAMQLAQKAMIEGKLKSDSAGNLKGIELAGGKQSQQPKFDRDPKAPFAHPYYWSPFILIGNWR